MLIYRVLKQWSMDTTREQGLTNLQKCYRWFSSVLVFVLILHRVHQQRDGWNRAHSVKVFFRALVQSYADMTDRSKRVWMFRRSCRRKQGNKRSTIRKQGLRQQAPSTPALNFTDVYHVLTVISFLSNYLSLPLSIYTSLPFSMSLSLSLILSLLMSFLSHFLFFTLFLFLSLTLSLSLSLLNYQLPILENSTLRNVHNSCSESTNHICE